MSRKLLVFHGGGPTAVINASLAGVIDEAYHGSHPVDTLYAARGGSLGLCRGDLVELNGLLPHLDRLSHTPGSAIGTSRDPMDADCYDRMVDVLKQHDIHHVLVNGGNGSMDCCGHLQKACDDRHYEANVIGIPKTIDNDLAMIDHAPGYASAARYIAYATAELCCDVSSLPIHISILEAMGRTAGWIAAASSMAEEVYGQGPDYIYTSERPFSEEQFLKDVAQLVDSKGHGVIVVSEGLHDPSGQSIVPPIMTIGRATYYGDVSTHLAQLIVKHLGYKARSEKPGILGRTSVNEQSPVDRSEAYLVGQVAVRASLAGEHTKMVGIVRHDKGLYSIDTPLVPIESVMLTERLMPDHFINEAGNHVTAAFKSWCRPLLGAISQPMLTHQMLKSYRK